jgi:copper(I)-binding protein
MLKHLLFAALLLAPLATRADDATVTVEQAWTRARAGNATSGGVYLTVTAHGAADQMIGIITPVAEMAMIHESFTEAGVSKMRMLDSVRLEPNQKVVFQPGGLHIMLEGLTTPIKRGTSFKLTVSFAHAAPQTVTVTVLSAGANGPDDAAK